jgi:hypothetical protein
VLCSERGVVRVCDFGITGPAGADYILGQDPEHPPPPLSMRLADGSRIRDHHHLVAQANNGQLDVFACAVLLFELLDGKLPACLRYDCSLLYLLLARDAFAGAQDEDDVVEVAEACLADRWAVSMDAWQRETLPANVSHPGLLRLLRRMMRFGPRAASAAVLLKDPVFDGESGALAV